MGVEAKLKELGLELPPTPRPAANYVGAVQTSNLLFISRPWTDERLTRSSQGPLGEGYFGGPDRFVHDLRCATAVGFIAACLRCTPPLIK
jgi:hypothetical protein